MKKSIDPLKLKVKYVLGNYSQLEGYPTFEDIIFDLITDYCNKSHKEIKFTDALIQKRYNISIEKTSLILEKLVNEKLIKEIKTNSSYSTYKVLVNPYQ